MPLSWNEIRHRAIACNTEWPGETPEAADVAPKHIYDDDTDAGHPLVSEASNISPYLTPGSDRFATKRTGPLGRFSNDQLGLAGCRHVNDFLVPGTWRGPAARRTGSS